MNPSWAPTKANPTERFSQQTIFIAQQGNPAFHISATAFNHVIGPLIEELAQAINTGTVKTLSDVLYQNQFGVGILSNWRELLQQAAVTFGLERNAEQRGVVRNLQQEFEFEQDEPGLLEDDYQIAWDCQLKAYLCFVAGVLLAP